MEQRAVEISLVDQFEEMAAVVGRVVIQDGFHVAIIGGNDEGRIFGLRAEQPDDHRKQEDRYISFHSFSFILMSLPLAWGFFIGEIWL